MKQKAIFVDYRGQLKDCENMEDVHDVLLYARNQWEAVGGTVHVYYEPYDGIAHLVISGVAKTIMALVRVTTNQGPDISYVNQE